MSVKSSLEFISRGNIIWRKKITSSIEYLALSNIISGVSQILWDNGYDIMDIVEMTFRTSYRHI